MSTQNAANGKADTPEKAEQSAPASRSKRSSSSRSAGIVKSDAKESSIIVLEDQTRLLPTDYLPNHRPIEASDFEVVGTLDAAGMRPIMSNGFEIADSNTLPGHRPIAMSTLQISDLHTLPGNRPIAPNDVIDPPAAALMGYLD
ncbi:hypothetical protein C7271_25045 [filamentous cyanobacterium CCP5]|nr:hypothetical protein C7271_25045 [filamentous cyanobacterium CCP5]